MADHALAAAPVNGSRSQGLATVTTSPTSPESADDVEVTGAPSAPDGGTDVGTVVDEADDDKAPTVAGIPSGIRLGLLLGLIVVVTLGGFGGWFGWCAYQAHRVEQQRQAFLQVGRQAALNLTTIEYTEADADIQRILDSSTGQFHDDFQQRAPTFLDVVKQAKSNSVGSIKQAGLDSVSGDTARVIVAVSVKTSNAGAAEQQPRNWRMRIDVSRVGEQLKVSNVGFVP